MNKLNRFLLLCLLVAIISCRGSNKKETETEKLPAPPQTDTPATISDELPGASAPAKKPKADTSETGNAALFGDDKREQAKEKFEQEIKDYETKNPNLPPTCDAQKP